MKPFILLFILFLSSKLEAQIPEKTTQLYKSQNSAADENHLKGPVKTVRFFYTQWKENLTEREKKEFSMQHEISSIFYMEFDAQERMVGRALYLQDSIDQPINRDKIWLIVYDEKDFARKQKYASGLKIEDFPVYNYYRQIRPNIIMIDRFPNGEGETRMQYLYAYTFYPNGSVKTEREYIPGFEVDSVVTIPIRDYLNDSTIYFYNAKGLLTEQRSYAGPAQDDSYKTEAYLDDYLAFGNTRYLYDTQDRMKQIVRLEQKQIVLKETYTYHPTEGYIQTIKHEDNAFAPKLSTYNKNGDLIEYTRVTQSGYASDINYYYEYEYDNHNNWIKCKLYLEGNKDEPTVIAERLITYY